MYYIVNTGKAPHVGGAIPKLTLNDEGEQLIEWSDPGPPVHLPSTYVLRNGAGQKRTFTVRTGDIQYFPEVNRDGSPSTTQLFSEAIAKLVEDGTLTPISEEEALAEIDARREAQTADMNRLMGLECT